MSFYHQYRPIRFAQIIGQDHIKKTLQNAIKDHQLVHAYLFCGTRGTGKTSTARILAKAINCQNITADGEPCDSCQICLAINKGNLVDLIEIDAASNRGIDEMRDLREKIQFSPTQGKNKIYIIDEVHMLTKEAFNAILKTLEEPPAHAYFILATTEAHKIPETIVSRCQNFNFRRIDNNDIIKMLNIIAENEKIEIEDDALLLIARQANGGMRDAISIFEQMSSGKKITYEKVRQCLGLVGHQFHENFYRLLQDSALQKSFTALQELNREGYDLLQFCQEFLFYLREKMLENLDNYEIIQEIVFITTTFSRAKDEIKSAIIPQLPLEVAIIEVCHRKNIIPQNNQSPKKGFLESWGFGSSKTEKIMDQDQSATIKTKNTESLTQPKAEVSIDDHLIREENFDKTNAIPEVEEALSLEDVKSNWNRVFDKINTPFIKISLKDCLPTAIENKTIILTFKSKFHLGKIAEIKNKLEVMNAIEETIKYKIDLECRLGKIEEVVPPPSAEKQENIKEMIQEIFG